jgi:hypothetical protein
MSTEPRAISSLVRDFAKMRASSHSIGVPDGLPRHGQPAVRQDRFQVNTVSGDDRRLAIDT